MRLTLRLPSKSSSTAEGPPTRLELFLDLAGRFDGPDPLYARPLLDGPGEPLELAEPLSKWESDMAQSDLCPGWIAGT